MELLCIPSQYPATFDFYVCDVKYSLHVTARKNIIKEILFELF